MSKLVTTFIAAAGILVVSAAALAAPKLEADDLPGPQPEVAKDTAKVDLPPIPAFDLPAVAPGFHSPRELRVRGKPLLGSEIKVAGYVTWIYDCVSALAAGNPTVTRIRIAEAIDKDPTLCDRPRFYLGDARTTSQDTSIWVVDAPRAPTKAERAKLSPADLAKWPAVPKLAVGDYVAVTGTWATQTPFGEHNTGGLLIYRALDHAPPAQAAPAAAPADEPEVTIVTKAPMRPHVSDTVRNASVDRLNACIKANNARQFDSGIAECKAAVKAWDGNHLAWYTLASAHMAKNEWADAKAAVEHAVTQRPDQGMYQLYYGIALFELAHQQAKPDAPVPLDDARDALRRAVKLAPELWRAHYYLGRVYRELDDARHAAEQFTATIATYPSYRFGYVALIELYRKWDYVDQALAVASLGTTNVAAADAGDLWYELGMAYDARHATDQAIDAFTKAIASKPDDPTPKFQRGQLYYRKRDFAAAKRDLEEIASSNDPRMAAAKPVASQLLTQIAKQAH